MNALRAFSYRVKRGYCTALVIVAVLLPAFVLASDLTSGRALQRGMSGNDVKALQEHLLRIPGVFEGGEATGFFGGATEKAVQKFQSRAGIVRSGAAATTGFGRVGPRTLAKLNEAITALNAKAVTMAAGSLESPLTRIASSVPSTKATTTQVSSTTSASVSTGVASSKATDTTPPARSLGRPSVTLPATTTWVTVSLNTNEPANCYWSSVPNTSFDYMSNAFKITGGTLHSSVLWLEQPGDYAFFVRCRDQMLNKNASDYPILFSIWHRLSGIDRYVPRVVMSYPTEGDVIAESRVPLAAAASDNTGVAQVRFFLNDRDLNAEDTSSPFSVTVILQPGSYRAFAVARDLDDNVATSTPISFTVVAKSASTQKSAYLNLASVIAAVLSLLEGLFRF